MLKQVTEVNAGCDSFMPVDLDIKRKPDGTILLRSNNLLPEHDPNIVRVIMERARFSGGKAAFADRTSKGHWRFVTFTDFATQVRSAGQWLIDRVPRGATLMIVADNSPEVAIIFVAGLAAGLRVLPVGPGTALANDKLLRLRHIVAKSKPAVVYVDNNQRIIDSVRSVIDETCAIITAGTTLSGSIAFGDVTSTKPTPAIDKSISNLDVSTTACLMMTSGSSGLPKLVKQSLTNMAANTAQGLATLGPIVGWHEASLDWLPWNHAAGSAVLRASLMLGGTLYIDRGKPTPDLFAETVRNLREISVPYFNNVPLGYSMLTDALENDAEMRKTFFKRMRIMIYGGAGLPQSVKDRLQQMAFRETGRYIPVTTGYGATETVAGCLSIHFECDKVGIGLPAPAIEMKLVPVEGRYALSLRGPNIMLGYLDEPELTTQAFDEDGYYRTGDLVRFQDDARPELGLVFAGRQTEEFKLSNGTWVYGGQLRTQLLDALTPLVQDVVLCDDNKPYLSLLVWPNDETSTGKMEQIAAIVRDFNNHQKGAASRIRRLASLVPPPNPAESEISEKGSLVRRKIIENRTDLVDQLYADEPDGSVFVLF